jgi:hypothetical protein
MDVLVREAGARRKRHTSFASASEWNELSLILTGFEGEIASGPSLFPIAPASLMLMIIIRR